MAKHELSFEKLNNLAEVWVGSMGGKEGCFRCDLKFDTDHAYSCGFRPDKDWYWADLEIYELQHLVRKGTVKITFEEGYEYLKDELGIQDKPNSERE